MASKRSLTDVMNEENLTIKGLADRSGLCETTAQRAVRSNGKARLSITSATAIAESLGLSVGEINWPGGLANSGRPALSGGNYSRRSG